MRLIDAGHLYDEVEKLKESPWFNDDTNGARIIRREALNIVEDLCICKEPTVCDIEQIRAEIDCYLKNNEFGTEYRNDIKNIIAKYAEQEPCDDDYQTDMDEAWKQAKREPCDDVVSRQAVLKIIDGWYEQNRDTENIEDLIVLITYMDSVRPQELTREEQALLQKWRNNRGISMEEFAEAMNALQEPQEGGANNG